MSSTSEENEKFCVGEWMGEFADAEKRERVSKESLLPNVREVNLGGSGYSSGNVLESEMTSSWEDTREDCDKDKYEISC